MKEFLKRVKLNADLTTELEIQKSDFVNKLQQCVDDGEIGYLSCTFDVFSSSNNEFKGKVNIEGFSIKRKKRFFDMHTSIAIATGTYTQKDKMLIIDTEITGFYGIMIFFFICLILIYIILIISFATANEIGGNMPRFLAIPFILFHATLAMGIPYVIMRKSTRKLKWDMERELFYVTKK